MLGQPFLQSIVITGCRKVFNYIIYILSFTFGVISLCTFTNLYQFNMRFFFLETSLVHYVGNRCRIQICLLFILGDIIYTLQIISG